MLKQNMTYVNIEKKTEEFVNANEQEEIKQEGVDMEKLHKKSVRLVDTGIESIVHLNEYMINKFLTDRYYIVELKKWMFYEKLEKQTAMTLGHFMKIITFEDFVHD